MRVISFLTQKGGTGKSTLALNLAVAAELSGERVVVVDLDPQGTAASWHQSRGSETPVLIWHTEAGSIDETIQRLSEGGFTLVLIDTPGTENSVTRGAMCAADLCLVPVRPSEADVRATMPTVRTLSALGRNYALVVNQAPARLVSNAPLRIVDDGPVLPVVIAARVDHQYAYALGQGVQEFAPEGKAAAEIIELWRAVQIRMGLMEGRAETCVADLNADLYRASSAGCVPVHAASPPITSSRPNVSPRLVNSPRSAGPYSGLLAVGPRPCS